MQDIAFDIITREIIMTGSGETSDFVLTDNPSVQNGGILLFSRCAVLNAPMAGVGVEEFMGSHPSVASFEMNRWQAMAKADGATLAKWSATVDNNSLLLEQVDVNYLPK